LVIPRKIQSKMALLCLELGVPTSIKNLTLKEIADKLADVLMDWNLNKYYANVPLTSNQGNWYLIFLNFF
jgi:hypothetical protein